MGQKLTTIKITTTILYIEDKLLECTGLTRAAFHRKAIDSFLSGSQEVDDDLKITATTDPRYVKKTTRDRVYLDDDRRRELEMAAEKNGVGITIVLFQAILDYCLQESYLLPKDIIDNIIS